VVGESSEGSFSNIKDKSKKYCFETICMLLNMKYTNKIFFQSAPKCNSGDPDCQLKINFFISYFLFLFSNWECGGWERPQLENSNYLFVIFLKPSLRYILWHKRVAKKVVLKTNKTLAAIGLGE
jgi:hypothetical protein